MTMYLELMPFKHQMKELEGDRKAALKYLKVVDLYHRFNNGRCT